MHRRFLRSFVLLVSIALVAAACGGSDRSASEDSTPDPTAGTESDDDAEDGPATFGDLDWPCGPGDAAGDTAQGVTDESITIGTGDDRGFPSNPGLNKEATDAMLAMVDVCNEMGGISGRQLDAVNYDAQLFDVASVMAEACDAVFMLVGQSWALDGAGEEVRNGCGLATVPGFSVSAEFAHGPRMRQAVPNPADRLNVGHAFHLAELHPDEITNTATLFGNFAATEETKDKLLAAFPAVGFEFVANLPYNVGGEEDWTPFILQLEQAEAELVYFTGSCENFQLARQAATNNDFDAIWFSESNFYSNVCSDLNTDGAMDGSLIRISYIPLEEAEENQATADFVALMEDAGVEPSLLGAQASASFLLWATAAAACGSDLTADCVIAEIDELGEWSAGGLHAPTDPAGNVGSSCSMLLRMVGRSYERAIPAEVGTLDCRDEFVVDVDTPALRAAQMNDDRVSTVYLDS